VVAGNSVTLGEVEELVSIDVIVVKLERDASANEVQEVTLDEVEVLVSIDVTEVELERDVSVDENEEVTLNGTEVSVEDELIVSKMEVDMALLTSLEPLDEELVETVVLENSLALFATGISSPFSIASICFACCNSLKTFA